MRKKTDVQRYNEAISAIGILQRQYNDYKIVESYELQIICASRLYKLYNSASYLAYDIALRHTWFKRRWIERAVIAENKAVDWCVVSANLKRGVIQVRTYNKEQEKNKDTITVNGVTYKGDEALEWKRILGKDA